MKYSYMFLLAAAAAAGCDNTSQTRTDGVPVTPSSTSAVDRSATDRGVLDGSTTNRTATDRSVTDRTGLGPNATGPNATGRNATDRSVSGRSATDRNDTGKTPFDQYDNKADVDITAEIRSRVVDTDMSVSAQNAKIITQDGKVTLRGEVKSNTEKQHVETIALAVAGEGNVDNQLQIDQD